MVDEPRNTDASDDEAGAVLGHPVMECAQPAPDRLGGSWFEPQPPPAGADKLAIEAYELEHLAYERELERR